VSKQTFAVVTILAGLLLRIVIMVMARGMLIDDAYITLRYGRNLFLGRGLVFNPGEHALGAPPLYATLVGFLWRICDAIPGGERAVGYVVASVDIALMVAAGFLLSSMLRAEAPVAGPSPNPMPGPNRLRSLASCLAPLTVPYLPVALFALYVPFVDNTITGMETTLFVVLQLVSLHAFRRRSVPLAATALALSMLVRPEGILWTGAVLFTEVIQSRRPSLRSLSPLVAIVLGWVVVSTLYYGTPVPLNVLSKSGWMVSGDNAGAPTFSGQAWNVLLAFTLLPFRALDAGSPGPWLFAQALLVLLLVAFATGSVALWRRKDANLAFAVFFVVCTAAYVAGRGATWPSWYAIPPGLAFYVVASHGATFLLSSLGALEPPPGIVARRARLGALLLMVLVLGLTSLALWGRMRAPYYRIMDEDYGATGRYIRAHSNEGDSLLVWEVGCIGFLADRYTQEVAGIVSPRIFRLRREDPRQAETRALIGRFRPRFVVLRPQGRDLQSERFVEWFRDRYEPVFKTGVYWTYRRRDAAGWEERSPAGEG
jgi:hypothetical protein